jgi:CheY-like chemotaxis protein
MIINPQILVIEDDSDIREMLKVLLSKSYRVIEAANGQEGVRLFYESKPDLVLMDVTMPIMDGWEALARIRDMAKTPVIMLTAKGGIRLAAPLSSDLTIKMLGPVSSGGTSGGRACGREGLPA